jgi:hypothetical protein
MRKKFFVTISAVFIALSVIILLVHKSSALYIQALMGANFVLFIVSILSFQYLHTTLMSGNSKKFILQIMLLLIIKLFVYALMVVAIILFLNKEVPSVLIYFLLIMYLVYTFIDNRFILALNRSIDNK